MIQYWGYQNLERLRFAENIEQNLLVHMEGQRDTSYKTLSVGKIFLVRIHNQPNPFLFLIVALFEDYMLVQDKNLHHKIFKETGNYAKAFEKSLYKIDKVLFESASNITVPKDPDLMRVFKKFQKDFKVNIQDRAEFVSTIKTVKYYNSYNSKKELSDELSVNRSDLAILKAEHPEEQERYDQGLFQLATIIYRLKATKTSEPQMFYEELYEYNKEKLQNIDIIDYGFLDSELKSDLALAGLLLEYNLFIAFLNGQNFLALMLELYKYYHDKNDFEKKSKYISIFKLLAEKKQFDQNEKKIIREFIIDKVDLYYTHLFE